MKIRYAFILTLLPGLVLASCAPAPKPATPEQPAAATPAPEPAEPQAPPEEAAPAPMPEQAEAEPAPQAEAAPETEAAPEAEWVSLFDGETLNGWTQRGAATWQVVDGVMTGTSPGGQGHIYADPILKDLEVKGKFRISDQGGGANSGLYFRANPPEDNIDGYPRGYEAQICHNQDAYTGWLWKPGAPTGEATKLLTKDDEWFDMRVKAVGPLLQIWVNEELVMTYDDAEYTEGHFAIQCHNEGMTIEAKDLFYRDLGGS
ncbi:MAG: DUF1080 domain-containing protein [Candidatus Hydrogenedentes bacterium]|nr:DUF1080 domain-containing protein [Candidatus Hydrogenedentota bacterium]